MAAEKDTTETANLFHAVGDYNIPTSAAASGVKQTRLERECMRCTRT